MKNLKTLLLSALAIALVGCATHRGPEAGWPEPGWGTDAPAIAPVTNTVPEPVWPTLP